MRDPTTENKYGLDLFVVGLQKILLYFYLLSKQTWQSCSDTDFLMSMLSQALRPPQQRRFKSFMLCFATAFCFPYQSPFSRLQTCSHRQRLSSTKHLKLSKPSANLAICRQNFPVSHKTCSKEALSVSSDSVVKLPEQLFPH